MSPQISLQNADIRREAVTLTRTHLKLLLAMYIMLSLFSFLAYTLVPQLTDLFFAGQFEALYTAPDPVATQPARFLSCFVLQLVLLLAASIPFSGLDLGMQFSMQKLCRNEYVTFGSLFSRMRWCLKSWALTAVILIKCFLWMLIPLTATLLGLTAADAQESDSLVTFLPLLFILLAAAVVIPAAVRHSLAMRLLADDPSCGIRECIHTSITLTKKRCWQLFRLQIPIILKHAGVSLLLSYAGSTIAVALFPSMSAWGYYLLEILLMLPAAYFHLQSHAASSIFYLKLLGWEEAQPVSYWLRDHTLPDDDAMLPEHADDAPGE